MATENTRSRQAGRDLILNSWKEKLGIETGRDFLIFLVVMGISITALITLAFAGLGYIAPLGPLY